MIDLESFKLQAKVSTVVAQSVKLKRSGKEFTGLCPFHAEKTPSFTVNDQKGFYHCFGCMAHGDAIDFAMQHDGLSFKDSINHVASVCNIEAPVQAADAPDLAHLLKANEVAADWFMSRHDKGSVSYLEGRGIGEELIEKFKIGHAPKNKNALIDHLMFQGFHVETIKAAGLAYSSDNGELFPRFYDRITFPVFNRSGRVCGFTARALGNAKAKYINSPSTPIFDKGKLLYGTKQLSRKGKGSSAVLVEGAMDVVAMSRTSIDAVAPLGTACTTSQLLQLWSINHEPIVCLDGDEAGLRAGRRLIDTALGVIRPGDTLSFVRLPKGQDPDDIVRSKGSAALAECLAHQIPMMDFMWRFEVREVGKFRGRSDAMHIKAHLFQRLKDAVSVAPDITVRRAMMSDISQRWSSFMKAKSSPGSFIKPPVNMAEAEMLSIALAQSEILDFIEDELECISFSDDAIDRCREVMVKWSMDDIGLQSGLLEYLIACGCGDTVLTLMNTVQYRNMSRDCPTVGEASTVWRNLSTRYFSRVERRMARDALKRAIEDGDDNEIMRAMEIYSRNTHGA